MTQSGALDGPEIPGPVPKISSKIEPNPCCVCLLFTRVSCPPAFQSFVKGKSRLLDPKGIFLKGRPRAPYARGRPFAGGEAMPLD